MQHRSENMQYTQAHIELAKKFLNNENVNLDYDVDVNEYTDGTEGRDEHLRFEIHVGERIWTDGTSIWSETKAVKGVKVDGLSFTATRYNDDEDENDWSGGLAGGAYYDGSGKDGTWNDGEEYTLEEKGGLINGMKKEGTSDGYIYTDDGFVKNLENYLVEKCDFDKALFDYFDFEYSEQGMQEAGAVNFDFNCDGDFWLAVKEQMDEDNLKLQAKAFA